MRRRFILLVAAVFALTVAVPSGAAAHAGPSRFPLAALWDVALAAKRAWAAGNSSAPKQTVGGPVKRPDTASASDTSARGGNGRKPGTVPGALDADRGLKPGGRAPWTAPPEKAGFVAATSTRVASAATRTSDLYQNADGSVTLKAYQQPVNYRGRDGAWRSIDTTLVRGAGGWRSAYTEVEVSLAAWHTGRSRADRELEAQAATDPFELATTTFAPGRLLGLQLQGGRRVEPAVSGSTAIYRSILPGTDLELTVFPDGVRETLVAQSASAPAHWLFPLRLEGLTARQRVDGVEITGPGGERVAFYGSVGATYELVKTGGGVALKVTAAPRDYPARIPLNVAGSRAPLAVSGKDPARLSFPGPAALAVPAGKRVVTAALDLTGSCESRTPLVAERSGRAVGQLPAEDGCGAGAPAKRRTLTLQRKEIEDWSRSSSTLDLVVRAGEPQGGMRFDSAAAALVVTFDDNVAPQVDSQYPLAGHAAPTLTPQLIAVARDPDAYPGGLTLTFQVYDKDGTKVADSGAIGDSSWKVPAGALRWGESYVWTVIAFDGNLASSSQTMNALMTPVPQPLITSGLSQNDDKGFNPQVGNYTTAAVDAQITSVGPALTIQRLYNSLDPRTASAFGAGWSTLLDASAAERRDPVTNAVLTVAVTYPTGQEMAFGRNHDGSFTPPQGRYATFKEVTGGGYELIDKASTKYAFTQPTGTGRFGLTAITDAQGRVLTLSYVDGKATTATSASGRKLAFAWTTPPGASAPHISSVRTDELVTGDPASASVWTYEYTGDSLTKVCPPTSATACATYGYTNNSLYPSTVQNLGPRSYFRLGDEEWSYYMKNSVVENVDWGPGIFRYDPLFGQPGPLAGSAATATVFNGVNQYAENGNMQNIHADRGGSKSVSLWFKTSTVGDGVLFGESGAEIRDGWGNFNSQTSDYVPLLYVGADGKLVGGYQTERAAGPLGTITASQGGRCIDAPNSQLANVQLQLNDCSATAETQRWTLDASRRLTVTKAGVTKCAEGDPTMVGHWQRPVNLRDCNTSTAQKWRVRGDNSLMLMDDGKCLERKDWGTDAGTKIVLQWCSEGNYSSTRWGTSNHNPMQTGLMVADGQWHHAVLSAAGDKQFLYIDGVLRGEQTGLVQGHGPYYTSIGAGILGGQWPNQSHVPANGSNLGVPDFFDGSIAEVALFDRWLSADDVTTMYRANRAAPLLTQVTRPTGGVTAQVAYDPASAVVRQVTDAHGGVWKVEEPVISGTSEIHAGAVLMPGPADYFRMRETGATLAVNEVNGGQATYNQVTLGVPGALFTDTTVASFDGATSHLTLPARDIAGAGPNSVSLWFKVPPGDTSGGVLYGHQSAPIADTAAATWTPALYVGTDGKLRGQFWNGTAAPLTSAERVNDGYWHHVALTAATGSQALYLDGNKVGTLAGALSAGGSPHAYVGAGKWESWPATAGAVGRFTGQLAEFAFYRVELTEAQVKSQASARTVMWDEDLSFFRGAGGGTLEPGWPWGAGLGGWSSDRTGTVNIPMGDFDEDGHNDIAIYDFRGDRLTLYSANEWGGADWRGMINRLVGDANYTVIPLGDHIFSPGDFNGDGNNDVMFVNRDNGNLYMARGGADGLGFLAQPTQKGTGWAGRELFSPGDFDGDGKVDVLYRRYSDQKLYLMRGNGTGGWLTGIAEEIGSGWGGRRIVASRGDFDGDGKPDVLFQRNSDGTVHMMRGNGVGGFLPGDPVAIEQDWAGRDLIIAPGTWNADALPDVLLREHNHWYEYDGTNIGYQIKTLTVTDPGNKKISHVYDIRTGREIEQTDARGGVTRYGYDTAGFLRSTTDPNGNVTVDEHDVRGNVIAKTTCQDRSEDKCSTVYTTYYPDATTKVLTPDPRNDLPLTVRDGRSASAEDDTYKTTYTYDTHGNRTHVTDPLGRVTQTEFTDGTTGVPAGLPWRITNPGGAVQTITYLPSGDVQRAVDAAGLATEFTYDALGRPSTKKAISDTYPAGLTTSFEYDRAGRIVEQADPPVINRVTGATHTAVATTVYDDDGHVTSNVVADGTGGDATRTVSNTYNARGQLETMTDARGKTRGFTYDSYGNKATETDPTGAQVAYTYDATGQLTSTTVKGWTGDPNFPSAPTDLVVESRAYDPAGRLASITDAMGWQTHYKYTDDGLTASVTRTDPSNGNTFVTEAHEYNAAGHEIARITNNGTTITRMTVDAAGRTVSQTLDPDGLNRKTEFTYADNDTVLTAKVTDGSGAVHQTDATYDVAGRKTSETVKGAAGGPVGWWKADETSGTAAADSSPAQRAMTAQGSGVSWSDGALTLNGSGSLQTNGPVLDNKQSLTVSAWARITDLGDFRTVVAQDAQRTQGFSLQYHQSSNRWALWKSSDDTTSPAQQAVATSINPPQLGVWTHLVAVYDATAAKIKLYVNGQLEGQTDAPPSFAARGPLVIGRGLWDGVCAYFAGSIDNVQVYQRAVGDSEAATLFARGRAGDALTVESVTRYTWEQRGLQTTVTDPNGHVIGYEHDEAGRPTLTTAPAVAAEENGGTPVTALPVTTTGYDTFGAVVQTRDAKGRVTVQVRDANGQVTEVHQPAYTPPGSSTPIEPVTKSVYNDAGQVTQTEDALQHTTDYVYDQLGRLAKVTMANGAVTTYTYTLNGDRLSQTDPVGARNETTYDFLGRKLTSTQIERQGSQAHVTAFAYDTAGRLRTVTPPGLAATTYDYNAAGETTRVTDGAGKQTVTHYDLLGRPITTIAADGTKQTVTYNALGKPLSRSDLDAVGTVLRVTSATYDAKGQMLTSTDGRGNTTTLTYDATGMLTQVVEPVSAQQTVATGFGYDLAGNQTRFTDGRGTPFITTYNPWDRVESEIEPGGAAFTIGYDAAARPVTQTAPGGVTITTTYDEVGNLTGQTGAGADATTEDRGFEYDLARRIIGVEEGSRGLTVGYNDRGQVLTVTGSAGASAFTYTSAGQMATRQDAAGTSTYTYDTAGRLATIADASTGEQATLGYDDMSLVTSIQYGSSGNTRVLGYDGLHRLASDELRRPGGTSIAGITYGYDANDNEISKSTTGFAGSAAHTYGYDQADRLTSWNEGTGEITFDYDRAGNRTRIGSRVLTYDERNQLTSDGNTTFSYTPRGTLSGTTEGTVTTPSTFDAYGQQRSQGGRTYAYDGMGRVVDAAGVALSYTGLGNDVAADGDATYSRDPDGRLFGTKVGSTGEYAWTDRHTDVVGQFTSAGTTLAGSRAYNPLGVITATAGLAGNLGYQSGWTDNQTGRVNMHARWYNPQTAQFASRDSVTVTPVPDSIRGNRFQYGDGNPMTVTDPTGHWGISLSSIKSGLSNAWNKTTQVVSSAYNTVKTTVSNAYNWAADRVSDLRDYVSDKWNQFKDWAGQQVNKVKQKIKNTVNKVKKVAAAVYNASPLKTVIDTTTKLVETAVERTTRLIEEGKKVIVDAYKAAETWVKEHKAEIAGFVVGAVVGIGCGIAIGWTGVGAVACGALAGAAGAAVTGAMQGKTGWDLVGDIAAGALFGGITGGLGSMAGAALSKGVGALWNGFGGKAALSGAWNAFKAEGANIVGGLRNVGSNVFGKATSGLKDVAQGGMNKLKSLFQRGCTRNMTHSFDPKTPVLMADGGTKAIAAITVGDKVLAADPKSGRTEAKPVTALHLNNDHDLTTLTVRNTASGTTSNLKTTQHHPFWDASVGAWVNAADLKAGKSKLTAPGGEVMEVLAVASTDGHRVMRDLTVDDLHTYYVLAGKTPVLVHNCDIELSADEADTLAPGPHGDGYTRPATKADPTQADRDAMQNHPCHLCGDDVAQKTPDHQPAAAFDPHDAPRCLMSACTAHNPLQAGAVVKALRILRNHGVHNPDVQGAYDFLRKLLPGHTAKRTT